MTRIGVQKGYDSGWTENLQPKVEAMDGECSEPEESVDVEPVSPKAPVDSLPPWLTPLFDWARRLQSE